MPDNEREPPYEEPVTNTHTTGTDEAFVASNDDNSAAEVGALVPARADLGLETGQQTSVWLQTTDSDIEIEPNLSWDGLHSIQGDPLQSGPSVSLRPQDMAWSSDDSWWALPPHILPFDFLAPSDSLSTV
jgi:hypothetical protein